MGQRCIKQILTARDGMDGAGVKLRSVSPSDYSLLDPFVEIDEIESNNPDDFFGGFPPHPHRGNEFLTYVRQGRLRHKDSLGNRGCVEAGGAQFLCAGRGAMHSEMPEPDEVGLHLFQIWINLPEQHKLCDPWYQDVSAEYFAQLSTDDFAVQVLLGRLQLAGQSLVADIGGETPRPSDCTVAEISLKPGAGLALTVDPYYKVLLYMCEGALELAGETVTKSQLAILSEGELLKMESTGQARCLLLMGKPLKETVTRGGPFVMNTEQDIQRAFVDFQTGKFGEIN
jgi:redox-sensitive bicupin YhaK (pirin superfamily)